MEVGCLGSGFPLEAVVAPLEVEVEGEELEAEEALEGSPGASASSAMGGSGCQQP